MIRFVSILLIAALPVFGQVNYLAGSFASASSSGTGVPGLPTLNYTPSAGTDRLLLFSLVYERDHSGAKGTNWANPKAVGGADPIVTIGAATMTRLRTSTYYQYSGTNNNSNATMSVEMVIYGILEASIPAGANDFVVSGISSPGHSGDEATVSAMMFENVIGVNFLGSGGCENCNGIGLAGLDPQDVNNMIVSFAAAGSDRAITAGAGNTLIGNATASNANGGFKKFSEQDGIGFGAQYVTGTTALQSSPFTVAGAADIFGVVEVGFRLVSNNVLPVELIEFEVYNDEQDNTLHWATAMELNNDRFEIERSNDGFKWDVVGEVYGQGSSMEEASYSFMDLDADCHHCYYRLKQVDYDGEYDYSPVILVTLADMSNINVYPNPVRDVVNIQFGSDVNSISIYSSSGVIMEERDVDDLFELKLNISSYPRGHYYVVIRTATSTETKRLVKL